MLQIVGDRFVRSGTAWIDLATGEAVGLRLAPAGSASAQMAWNGRCAQLANLRHPLINPLIDYGMAGAGRVFEAYAAYGPVRERGTRAESLLSHAASFLEAHEVALTRPLADFVLRPISIGSSGTARGTALRLRPRYARGSAQDAALRLRSRQAPGSAQGIAERRIRPLGISLQHRRVFDSIADALDAARPGGAWLVSIAGEPDSGLRTFRLLAARMARLQGYVPIAPDVLRTLPVGRQPSVGASCLRDWRGKVRHGTGRSDRVRAHATQRRKPSSSCRPVIRPPAGSRGRGTRTDGSDGNYCNDRNGVRRSGRGSLSG